MVGSMLHCFPTFVYFQLIAVTISSILSPWIYDGIYSFTQWSTCFHLSAILYGPANVHDFSRGKCLWTNHMNDMANGTFVNFSEIASLKFELKKNLGMFSFKKSNTLSSMQCEVTDRQMDVRQTWKTPSILVTWLDIKYHYYNCWSLHALRKPKYMQKREHLLITHNFIACLSVTQYKRRFFRDYINTHSLLQKSVTF